MHQAVIVSACRTPVGRFGGVFKDIPASELAAIVVKEAVRRAGSEPSMVNEVILGHVLENGESPNVARLALLRAGFPEEVPGHIVNRMCSSGLQAIVDATLLVQTGNASIVVAGGVESESQAEFYTAGVRWGLRLGTGPFYDRIARAGEMCSCPERYGTIPSMMHTSESLAQEYGITREEQDRFALRSHQNAVVAIDSGKFDEEIVPVPVRQPKGQVMEVTRDEHPRAGTSLEQLASLPALLGGTHTAGNSSGINDGAAAVVVMSEEQAKKLGRQPMAYFRGFAAAGVSPALMGIGPVPAVKAVLQKLGLTLTDMDLIELNEAFAGQALAVLKELGITEFSNLNVNGSGISIGHPLGATGARIMTTLLYEMKRRNARYGLETMCVGGGMGLAAVVERPPRSV